MSLLLGASIIFNFLIGIHIEKLTDVRLRKRAMAFGVIVNLCLLGFFKYTIFILDLFRDIPSLFGEQITIWRPEILLPVGISFYTFHNISYLIEIKKRNIAASRSIIDFSVYDIFFPLLLAGPIERPNSLIPQLQNERILNREKVFKGLSIFVWGVFQKTVIADPLARFVDGSLSHNGNLPGGILLIVAPAFAFQVYADFSGYSNCARGLAYMMGFNLMNNFHRPFFASNPVMFWQRWHISLSSWLRDYVYIPLGGNRDGFLKQNINILIVWILGGLWHGATYGYLVWGFYLGLCIIVYNIIKKYFLINLSSKFEMLYKGIGIFVTFYSFAFGLLLFRVKDSTQLFEFIKNLFLLDKDIFKWSSVLLFFIPIIAFDLWQAKIKTIETDRAIKERPIIFSVIFILFFSIFALVSPFAKQEFFYFQF
ncbi:MAG: MBOAT family O-acyltransferase [Leptospira sp.]|nr:MBOAT family O-acyltransferase [Leptospira sp.]